MPEAVNLPTSTGDPVCFEKVKLWIAFCDSNSKHRRCKARDDLESPKRLLDVGVTNGSNRLRLCEDFEQPVQYLALSHCWGPSGAAPKTLKTSLQQHRQSIEERSLSKTFQDAVQITRGLNYRYLWIDALCIVQDDPQDWRIEASKMGDIYEGASLTMAALSAYDGSGGLFTERDPDRLVGSLTPSRGDVVARRPISHDLTNSMIKEWVYEREPLKLEEFPLMTRKWAFQEQMLSRRILYYTHQEIIWECRSGLTCECKQRSYNWSYMDDGGDKERYASLLPSISKGRPDAKSGPKGVLRGWLDLVEEYSKWLLTKEEDVFPAFAGVARSFVDCGFGRYLAGLWETHFPHALAWTGKRERRTNSDASPDSYIAPTWSWASIPGKVDCSTAYMGYPGARRDPSRAQVVSCLCTPNGPDSFGRLSSGILELSALWFRREAFNIDERSYERWTHYYSDTEIDLLDVEDSPACFLLLMKTTSKGRGYTSTVYLVLRPSSGDTFRRIGLFEENLAITNDRKVEGLTRKTFRIE